MNNIDHNNIHQKGNLKFLLNIFFFFFFFTNFFILKIFVAFQFLGHLLDEHHHGIQGQMTPIYGSSGALRAASNSNSPGNLHGQPSTLLVVPQPINATKMSSGLPNGSGRKYQCKMCPQVRAKKVDKTSFKYSWW